MAEPATDKQPENRKVQPKKPVIGEFLYIYSFFDSERFRVTRLVYSFAARARRIIARVPCPLIFRTIYHILSLRLPSSDEIHRC